MCSPSYAGGLSSGVLLHRSVAIVGHVVLQGLETELSCRVCVFIKLELLLCVTKQQDEPGVGGTRL